MNRIADFFSFLWESPYDKAIRNSIKLKCDKAKDKDYSIMGWTSWYCPLKYCDKIIYDTKGGRRDDISLHLREHGYAEVPIL